MAISPFDRPIPGQSLTRPPKNAAYEKPAQFNTVDEAMDFLMKSIGNTKKLTKFIIMLDNEVPVEALVRTTLMGGFTEGKWNMDLAMLLAKPLAGMFIAAYFVVRNKRPPRITLDEFQNGYDEGTATLLQQFEPTISEAEVADKMPEVKKELPKSGLMGAV